MRSMPLWYARRAGPTPASIRRVRRATVLAALLVAVLAAPARADWETYAAHTTVDAAMLQTASDGRFHGEWLLSGAQLRGALQVVGELHQQPLVAVASTDRVSVAGFHRLLI